MITTDEAAELVGTTRVTINNWIKSSRCIGVANLRRGFKLPAWQFQASIWPVLQPLAKSLAATDGWKVLTFLETPFGALNGKTPRASLEQGALMSDVLSVAMMEAH